MSGELNGLHFEKAKVRNGLGAVTHNDKFNLGDDEAVSTVVVAHVFVEVGEAAEVFYLAVVAFDAHACVPAVKRFDKTNDPA